MTVELAKLVGGIITQRCRFSIHHTAPHAWWVQIIEHRDHASRDHILSQTFGSEQESMAHVYASLVNYFSDYSVDEWTGGEVSWGLAAYDTSQQEYLELALLAATGAMSWLEDELELDHEDMVLETGEPIIWGTQNYVTGEVTRICTECPIVSTEPNHLEFGNESGEIH